MKRTLWPVLIFLSGFVLCFWNSWGSDIYILDEAKNARCAVEMWQSDHHITPTFNDLLRTDKPPLHYYMMMGAYELGGVRNWTARLGSALFGAWTILITYLLARRFLDEKTARMSALALLASIHFLLQHHLAVPDPYLITMITGALASFYHGVTTGARWSKLTCYTCMALGTLAKGPIAVALPGLIALIYSLTYRINLWTTIRTFYPILGILIFIAITVPWYYLVGEATEGAWLRGFFLDHNLHRFSSPKEGHGGPFIVTPIMVFVGMLPLSVWVYPAVRRAWRERRQHSLLAFAMIAAGVVVGFFSISETKLPNYPVPSYPFIAILLGYYLTRMERIARWAGGLMLFFALAIPIGGYFGLKSQELFHEMAPATLCLSILPVGVLASMPFWKKKPQLAVHILVATYIIGAIVVFSWVYPAIDRCNPVFRSKEIWSNYEHIVAYRYLNPAFVFHHEKTIPKFDDLAQLNAHLNTHPNSLIISRDRYAVELNRIHSHKKTFANKDLFESPVTIILEPK